MSLNAYKHALAEIASGTLTGEQARRLAHTTLTAPAVKTERMKEEKDRKRAIAAIRALESFLAAPDSGQLRTVAEAPLPEAVREAAKAELYRLGKALDRPAALGSIYRRNEK